MSCFFPISIRVRREREMIARYLSAFAAFAASARHRA
jgi:hypothetical protein